MNKLKYVFFSLMAFSIIVFSGCKDDPEPVNPNPVTYSEAASVFNVTCAFSGCHESGAQIGSLASYDDAKAFAEFGRIKGAINHQSGFQPMPKNGQKMSQANIDKIEGWIDGGYAQ